MGTNFFLHEKQPETCPHCGHAPNYEPLHIGKSSIGWCFSLHVIPAEGLHTLDDWQARWSKPGSVIKDEYDYLMTLEAMLKRITERGGNLLRHTVDRTHCIGHGPGTYDYITGWFR